MRETAAGREYERNESAQRRTADHRTQKARFPVAFVSPVSHGIERTLVL